MCNLQVVVMENLDEGIPKVGDLHALLDAMDQQNGVHVRADVVQQACDERWRRKPKKKRGKTHQAK